MQGQKTQRKMTEMLCIGLSPRFQLHDFLQLVKSTILQQQKLLEQQSLKDMAQSNQAPKALQTLVTDIFLKVI